MPSQPEPGRPRVLLVEPDLFFAARIVSVLRNLGYDPVTVALGEEAVASAAASAPAFVVLALASPTVGGLATVRRLKALPAPPRVLAYLPHVRMADVRDEALEAGVDQLSPNSAVIGRLPLLVDRLLRGERTVETE